MTATPDTIDSRSPEGVLRGLWRNWALAYGAITLPILVGSWLPKIWIPFIAFVEVWALVSFMRTERKGTFNSCSLALRLASRVLILAAIAMLAINILCTDWLVPTVIHLNIYNSEIPFITCLVTFPVVATMCALYLYAGFGNSFCRNCQRRNGYYAGDSIVATLYFRESRYQVFVLMVVALLLGAVEYWYYFFRYINSNLNTPDRFFFNYMPLALYLLSLVFMAGRYASMRTLYRALEEANPGRRNHTTVRYLIFCGDEIILHQNTDGQWDTPAEALIERTDSIGDHRARLLFTELTGAVTFDMRYCFTNEGFVTGSNIIHYAVFVDQEQRKFFSSDDVWFNAYMLDRSLAENALGHVLANELYRLHTITMAWKTYDRNGRRLYPIRNYRPTFRLRDLRDWTVDYDDQSWFDIANNNEDKRFFRLRSLWDRMTGFMAQNKRRNEA